MRQRYVICLPRGPLAYRRWRPVIMAGAAAQAGFQMAMDCDRCSILCQGAALMVPGEQAGIILGQLIPTGGMGAARALNSAQGKAILTSRGRELIISFWGAYIAVLPNAQGGIDILRAPFGDLACYYATCPDGLILASDIDLLRAFGQYVPALDWPAIAEHLIAADLRRPQTCLSGVRELSGGERLSWTNGAQSLNSLWSPWAFVSRDRRIDDPLIAAAQLARIVRESVAARTAGLDHAVLLLSGGLDSSIVAACLAHAGRRFTATTMVTRDPGGDERGYARTTARHLSIPLIETIRDLADVDVTRSVAAGLPRPSERSFSQATMNVAQATADRLGAGAIVHGGGGDNIFCALQSAAPVADRLLSARRGGGLWRLTHEIATLAQVDMFTVMRHAATRAWLRSPAYRWPADRCLLTQDAVAHAAGAIRHPWLTTPQGALPGSAAHIALIAAAQSLVESPDARAETPAMAVLIAQPVVEACLAVPSWNWFDRGANRAIARHGFAPLLPDKIAWRRSKGAMDSFVIEIFEANREHLKAMLLDGALADRGVIDRKAVSAVLDDPAPTRGRAYARVMQLADVEAWVQSWR